MAEEVISPSTMVGQYNATLPTFTNGKPSIVQTDINGRIITSSSGSAPIGGGITWGAPTAVAGTGSSKTFVPANAARKALMYWSPAGNGAAAYRLDGGVVTLAGGLPLFAGGQPSVLDGAGCPLGIVTAIWTSAENLYYVEGT